MELKNFSLRSLALLLTTVVPRGLEVPQGLDFKCDTSSELLPRFIGAENAICLSGAKAFVLTVEVAHLLS